MIHPAQVQVAWSHTNFTYEFRRVQGCDDIPRTTEIARVKNRVTALTKIRLESVYASMRGIEMQREWGREGSEGIKRRRGFWTSFVRRASTWNPLSLFFALIHLSRTEWLPSWSQLKRADTKEGVKGPGSGAVPILNSRNSTVRWGSFRIYAEIRWELKKNQGWEENWKEGDRGIFIWYFIYCYTRRILTHCLICRIRRRDFIWYLIYCCIKRIFI